MTKQIYLFFLLLLPSFSWGQNGFEKVYLFGDTLTLFSSVQPSDSCIYYMSSTGNNTNRLYLNFGKLDLNGEILQSHFFKDSTCFQYSGYQYVCDDGLNFRGNFVFSYSTLNAYGLAPRLVEITPDGSKLVDTTYAHIWLQDSLNCTAYNNIALLNDSSYLLVYNYGDYNTDSNSPGLFDGMIGAVVYKVKYDGTILWEKKFQFPVLGFAKPPQRNIFIRPKNDNSFILGLREDRITGQFDADDYAKNYFINCDADGNEIDRDVFQDTPYCYGTPGYQELPDGTSIFGYFDSYLVGTLPNNDEVYLHQIISRLNSNHQLIWKLTLSNEDLVDPTESVQISDIVLKNDGFLIASTRIKNIESPKYDVHLQLDKIDYDGNFIWSRNWSYFPIDSIQDPSYSIKDIDTTADGGLLLAGVCFKWDDNQGNKPYQYGYLLKTNCLGFLGAPQAAATILSSTMDSVIFQNQSVQAGSYTWVFGDGQSTTTTEEVDTMVHHYAQAGTYTITLIAHGCNNENDTITFQHTIADPTPIYHGDGTLLTVFPNPLVAGNSLSAYIGAIDTPHDLVLVDELGKVLFKQSVVSGNTNYLLPTNQLAAAQYRLQLMQSNKMIESEAVIVVE